MSVVIQCVCGLYVSWVRVWVVVTEYGWGGSLVPRVRGVVGVVYRIVVVYVGVVLGPDRLVRELVLVGGIVVRVGRM